MERTKTMKLVAVESNLGTNLLLCAGEDTTMSELRGLIQKEHISCFPEHGCVTIGALMVEYAHKKYNVTDSLAMGQIFHKRWNKIHAIVSSGSLKGASTLDNSKHTQAERFANGTEGNSGAFPDKPLDTACKDLGLDGQCLSDDTSAQDPMALLRGLNVIESFHERASGIQEHSIDYEKAKPPLLSSEAPYTQPCSGLNASTVAALCTGILKTKRKGKKRRDFEEDEGPAKKKKKKKKKMEVGSGINDQGSSPNTMKAISTKEEPKAEKGLESLQQYSPQTLCNDEVARELTSTTENNCFTDAENGGTKQHTSGLEGLDDCVGNRSKSRDECKNLLSTNIGTRGSGHLLSLDDCMANDSDLRDKCKKPLPTKNGVRKQHTRGSEDLNSLDDPMPSGRTRSDPCNDDLRQHARGSDDLDSLNDFMENDSTAIRDQDRDLVPTNPEISLLSCGEIKLPLTNSQSHHGVEAEESQSTKGNSRSRGSFEGEKGLRNFRRKAEDRIDQTLGKTETKEYCSCPKGSNSTRNEEEGTQEDVISKEAWNYAVDKSKGYPIKLNDHNILLVASLSADVVPETQESEMETQLGGNKEKMHTGCLVTFNSRASNIHLENEDTLKLKASQDADQPSKSLNPEEDNEVVEVKNASIENHAQEEHSIDIHGAGGKNISLYKRKKKQRKRKVTEMHSVPSPQDGGVAILDYGGQQTECNVDQEKNTYKNYPKEVSMETTQGERELCNQEKVQGTFDEAKNQAITNSEDMSNGKHETCDRKKIQSLNESKSRTTSSSSEKFKKLGSSKTEPQREILSKEARGIDAGNGKNSPQKIETIRSIHENNCNESVCFSRENIVKPSNHPVESSEAIEGSFVGHHVMTGQEKSSCSKEGAKKEPRKKRKRTKKSSKSICDLHLDAEFSYIPSNCESVPVDKCVNEDKDNGIGSISIKENKELPKSASIERDESKQSEHAYVEGEQVVKKKSKRRKKVKMKENTGVNVCAVVENVKDTNSHSKDGFMASPSCDSPLNEGRVTTEQGLDVFDFESSETGNRLEENPSHDEAKSNKETQNLDRLCSAAVKLVEDDMQTSSKTIARHSARKSVHPKRWIAVLSERLTWNQNSKSAAKKKVSIRNKLAKKGAMDKMPCADDINREACVVEDEGREASSQVIMDDGKLACPHGCGRLYSGKTSAYYRHRRTCMYSNY